MVNKKKGKVINDAMITLRISSVLLREYRAFCMANAIDMSKRIRKYMENDLLMWEKRKLEINDRKKSKKSEKRFL